MALAEGLANAQRYVLETLADTVPDVFKCGSAGVSLLSKDPDKHYPCFLPLLPWAEECPLVPFQVGGKTVGTIWMEAQEAHETHETHDNRRPFDAEDLRQLESLSRFASAACQTEAALDAVLKTEERYRTVFESAGGGFVSPRNCRAKPASRWTFAMSKRTRRSSCRPACAVWLGARCAR